MEVETPGLCIKMMHIASFIRLFNEALQHEYKDQAEATILNRCRYTNI